MLLAASRYEGLWGFEQASGSPSTDPDWIRCIRVPGDSRLADVAASSWTLDDEGEAPAATVSEGAAPVAAAAIAAGVLS